MGHCLLRDSELTSWQPKWTNVRFVLGYYPCRRCLQKFCFLITKLCNSESRICHLYIFLQEIFFGGGGGIEMNRIFSRELHQQQKIKNNKLFCKLKTLTNSLKLIVILKWKRGALNDLYWMCTALFTKCY